MNRSEGQTFKNVGIYLPQPVFAHGQQLYVAFSRGTDLNNIFVTIKSTTTQEFLQDEPETYTTNNVHHEILNM